MSRTIKLDDVPEEAYQELKAAADLQGLSLSDYIKQELGIGVRRITMKEWLDRVGKRTPIRTDVSGAEIIRKLRDAADR